MKTLTTIKSTLFAGTMLLGLAASPSAHALLINFDFTRATNSGSLLSFDSRQGPQYNVSVTSVNGNVVQRWNGLGASGGGTAQLEPGQGLFFEVSGVPSGFDLLLNRIGFSSADSGTLVTLSGGGDSADIEPYATLGNRVSGATLVDNLGIVDPSTFLVSVPNAANSGNVLIRNIRFETVASVPEPAVLALLGIGLAGIGFAKRKKT